MIDQLIINYCFLSLVELLHVLIMQGRPFRPKEKKWIVEFILVKKITNPEIYATELDTDF